MKKISLLLAIVFILCSASAQVSNSTFPKGLKKPGSYYDKYRMLRLLHNNKLNMQNLLAKDSLPNIDNMPITGNIPAPEFIGNNKKGFNVFTSPLDNMVIAKPDSSFTSNMPILQYKSRMVKP